MIQALQLTRLVKLDLKEEIQASAGADQSLQTHKPLLLIETLVWALESPPRSTNGVVSDESPNKPLAPLAGSRVVGASRWEDDYNTVRPPNATVSLSQCPQLRGNRKQPVTSYTASVFRIHPGRRPLTTRT